MAHRNPLDLRDELTADSVWGPIASRTKRFEIAFQEIDRDGLGLDQTSTTFHSTRASLVLGFGGGHLRSSRADAVECMRRRAVEQLDHGKSTPLEFLQKLVSWLDVETKTGVLCHAWVCATIVILVSDAEFWIWTVGPQGVISGRVQSLALLSTDVRLPALGKRGVKIGHGQHRASTARDMASSIFCVGVSDGYERIKMKPCNGDVIVVVGRAIMPFGPLEGTSFTLEQLWRLPSASRYGVPGHGVIIGDLVANELSLPDDWTAREIDPRRPT